MDRYYIDLAAPLGEDELATVIDFAFIDGVTGSMSRFEILLHSQPRHITGASSATCSTKSSSGRQRLYGVPQDPPALQDAA